MSALWRGKALPVRAVARADGMGFYNFLFGLTLSAFGGFLTPKLAEAEGGQDGR